MKVNILTKNSNDPKEYIYPSFQEEIRRDPYGVEVVKFYTLIRKKNENGVFCLIPVFREFNLSNGFGLELNIGRKLFLQDSYLCLLYYRIVEPMFNMNGYPILYVDANQEEEIDRLQPWHNLKGT